MTNTERAKARAQAVRIERFIRRQAEKENQEVIKKIRESMYTANPGILCGCRI